MSRQSNISLSNRAVFYSSRKATLQQYEESLNLNTVKKDLFKREIAHSSVPNWRYPRVTVRSQTFEDAHQPNNSDVTGRRGGTVTGPFLSERAKGWPSGGVKEEASSTQPNSHDPHKATLTRVFSKVLRSNPKDISVQWLERVGFTFSPFAFIFGTTFLFVALASTLQKQDGRPWLGTLSHTKLPGLTENKVHQRSSWVFLEEILSQYIKRDSSLLMSTPPLLQDEPYSAQRQNRAGGRSVPRALTLARLKPSTGTAHPRIAHLAYALTKPTVLYAQRTAPAAGCTSAGGRPLAAQGRSTAVHERRGTAPAAAGEVGRDLELVLSPVWSQHIKKDFLGVFPLRRTAPAGGRIAEASDRPPARSFALSPLMDRDGGRQNISLDKIVDKGNQGNERVGSVKPGRSIIDPSLERTSQLEKPFVPLDGLAHPTGAHRRGPLALLPGRPAAGSPRTAPAADGTSGAARWAGDKPARGTGIWPWYKIIAYHPANRLILPTWTDYTTSQVKEGLTDRSMNQVNVYSDQLSPADSSGKLAPEPKSFDFVRRENPVHSGDVQADRAGSRRRAIAQPTAGLAQPTAGRRLGAHRRGVQPPAAGAVANLRFARGLDHGTVENSANRPRLPLRQFFSVADSLLRKTEERQTIPFDKCVERLRLEDDSIPSKKESVYSKNKIHQDSLSARVLTIVKKSFYEYGLSIPDSCSAPAAGAVTRRDKLCMNSTICLPIKYPEDIDKLVQGETAGTDSRPPGGSYAQQAVPLAEQGQFHFAPSGHQNLSKIDKGLGPMGSANDVRSDQNVLKVGTEEDANQELPLGCSATAPSAGGDISLTKSDLAPEQTTSLHGVSNRNRGPAVDEIEQESAVAPRSGARSSRKSHNSSSPVRLHSGPAAGAAHRRPAVHGGLFSSAFGKQTRSSDKAKPIFAGVYSVAEQFEDLRETTHLSEDGRPKLSASRSEQIGDARLSGLLAARAAIAPSKRSAFTNRKLPSTPCTADLAHRAGGRPTAAHRRGLLGSPLPSGPRRGAAVHGGLFKGGRGLGSSETGTQLPKNRAGGRSQRDPVICYAKSGGLTVNFRNLAIPKRSFWKNAHSLSGYNFPELQDYEVTDLFWKVSASSKSKVGLVTRLCQAARTKLSPGTYPENRAENKSAYAQQAVRLADQGAPRLCAAVGRPPALAQRTAPAAGCAYKTVGFVSARPAVPGVLLTPSDRVNNTDKSAMTIPGALRFGIDTNQVFLTPYLVKVPPQVLVTPSTKTEGLNLQTAPAGGCLKKNPCTADAPPQPVQGRFAGHEAAGPRGPRMRPFEESLKVRYTPLELAQENKMKKAFKELGRDYSDYLKHPKDSLPALLLSPSLEDDKQIEEEEVQRLAHEKAAARAAAKRTHNEEDSLSDSEGNQDFNTINSLDGALGGRKKGDSNLEDEPINDEEIEDSRFERLRFTREVEAKKEEEDSRGLALSFTSRDSIDPVIDLARARFPFRPFCFASNQRVISAQSRKNGAERSSGSAHRDPMHSPLGTGRLRGAPAAGVAPPLCAAYGSARPAVQAQRSGGPAPGAVRSCEFVPNNPVESPGVSDRKHSFFGQKAFSPTRLFSQEERLVSAHIVNPFIRYEQRNPWLIRGLSEPCSPPAAGAVVHSRRPAAGDEVFALKNLQTQARLGFIRFMHLPMVEAASINCQSHLLLSQVNPESSVSADSAGLAHPTAPSGAGAHRRGYLRQDSANLIDRFTTAEPKGDRALRNPLQLSANAQPHGAATPAGAEKHRAGGRLVHSRRPAAGAVGKRWDEQAPRRLPVDRPFGSHLQSTRPEQSLTRQIGNHNRIYKPDLRLRITSPESSISVDWRNDRKAESSPFRVTAKERPHIVLPQLSENEWQKSLEWQLKRHFFEEDTRLEPLVATEPYKTFKVKKFARSIPWLTLEKPAFKHFQWPYKTIGVRSISQDVRDVNPANCRAVHVPTASLHSRRPAADAVGRRLHSRPPARYAAIPPRRGAGGGVRGAEQAHQGLLNYSRIPLASSFTTYSKNRSSLSDNSSKLFDGTKKIFNSQDDFNPERLFEPPSASSWFLIYRLFLALILKEVFKYIYRISLKDFFIRIINSDFGRTITSPEFRQSVQFEPFPEFYKPSNRLKDLIGIKNALLPLSEIIWFLRNNCRSRSGPHGVVLLGPEGVDTTAIAQAVAGEAKVPIIVQSLRALTLTHSHPQKRLEKVLHLARNQSPCVLFLDELDAIGKSREGVIRNTSGDGNSLISLDSSKISTRLPTQLQVPDDQTTSQAAPGAGRRVDLMLRLLTVMDGLHHLNGVVIITTSKNAATLDPALLRPGRFDRLIHLTLPNTEHRMELFKVKTKELGHTDQMPWEYLSRRTENMGGTDIVSAINYSALRAIVNDTVHTVETLEYGLNCVKALKEKQIQTRSINYSY